MNIIIRKTTALPYALISIACFLMLMIFLAVSGIANAQSQQSQTGRLITIHDRGIEKVILSEGATIGDAINDAGISVSESDVVEPGLDQKMVASDYQVNIYRSRPVIIVDGNVRQKVVTAYQTAEQITKSVGIVLYPEDEAKIGLSDDLSDGIGLQLTIKRAKPFSFTLFGETSTVRTQARTIGDMLIEKNITLTKDDRVVPGLSTQIVAGMKVRVWREGKQTVTENESVDFPIERIENADMTESYRAVRVPGKKGVRRVVYEVTIRDGKVVAKKAIASLTIKQPQKQVEVIGVKGRYTSPSENENITWNFLISKGYTRIQAAGIMGNLMQENGFKTNGDGLAQWTGGRKAALYSLPYPNNIYTQLNFLYSELTGPYAYVNNQIRASGSLVQSVQIFQNQFERCGVCMESNRIQYASNILASH